MITARPRAAAGSSSPFLAVSSRTRVLPCFFVHSFCSTCARLIAACSTFRVARALRSHTSLSGSAVLRLPPFAPESSPLPRRLPHACVSPLVLPAHCPLDRGWPHRDRVALCCASPCRSPVHIRRRRRLLASCSALAVSARLRFRVCSSESCNGLIFCQVVS